MESELLDKDLFVLSSNDKDVYIIYSPIRRRVMYTKGISFREIRESYNNVKENNLTSFTILEERLSNISSSPKQSIKKTNIGMNNNRLVLLLTNACNLGCIYCYAQEAHSKEKLTYEQVVNSVDYVLDNNPFEQKHFTFIGGGEPLVNWELLEKSIKYIRGKAANAHIGVQTNATLLDSGKIEWLIGEKVDIGCSFDILPEIQNRQRPYAHRNEGSFEAVDRNIRELVCKGAVPGIRTTIMPEVCSKMPEMVEYILTKYPEIHKIHFEHVSGEGLTWENYYSAFIDGFFAAKKIADSKGVYLKNSIIRSMATLKTRFCSGELCITPSGSIVSCHRVSSEKDNLFPKLSYGKVDNVGLLIDTDKRKLIESMYDNKCKKECASCFCAYHCAGQCCNNKMSYCEKDYEELCNFTREMVLRALENKLGLD